MKKYGRTIFTILTVLLSLAILSACGTSEEVPPGNIAPGISLSITGDVCPGVEVNANDQVTWKNEDNVNHPIEIKYPDGETYAGVDELQPGDTASFSFPQAGDYIYTCTEDGTATGTIKVNP